eukprot:CAMPEP_0197181272 /NCGR_PEP_ID=MMETSP1423-20130617/5610_1 /TAXON_ID=476441 /ORGANISM="Pseudo-nitzschia heimii, Strain UNC1101" /LENGTH=245 /DNA_ID=CAMNT_0042631497 /DNA_START=216 /DNA_END=954 /DNA_ORIENTATION=-
MSTPEEPKAAEVASSASASAFASDAAEDPAAKKAKLEKQVANRADRIMKHMNADHGESLVAYTLAFATGVEGTDPEKDKEDALLKNILEGKLAVTSARMTGVDLDGCLLEVTALEPGAPESEAVVLSNVRIPYDKPIESPEDVKSNLVAMHWRAYNDLGYWYKAKSGYYQTAAKVVAFMCYQKLKKSTPSAPVVAGVAALAAATAVAGTPAREAGPQSKATGQKRLAAAAAAAAAAATSVGRAHL